MEKYSIHDENKVKEILKENSFPTFRYKQIENAIYKNFINDFSDIWTIPLKMRELLEEKFVYKTMTVDTEVTSDDWQTTKMLFKTKKDEYIEAVIMRHRTWRVTLCVSSQVWCPMACTFCATWKLWMIRNLDCEEILEQVYYAANMLNNEWTSLRNVVFMGMWEPMLNYDNMKKSIEFMTNQNKFDLANRRITVSTCWIVPWIKKFTNDFPQTWLAISLHAPNDEVRSSIMPVDHTYPVEKLMASLDEYTAKNNKRIFYEYIMINWVNDHIKLADELGQLLKW